MPAWVFSLLLLALPAHAESHAVSTTDALSPPACDLSVLGTVLDPSQTYALLLGEAIVMANDRQAASDIMPNAPAMDYGTASFFGIRRRGADDGASRRTAEHDRCVR